MLIRLILNELCIRNAFLQKKNFVFVKKNFVFVKAAKQTY